MEKRPENRGNQITGGLIILIIGVFFLLQRLNIVTFKNWWAVFILIPAISSLGNFFQDHNRERAFRFSQVSNILGILFPVSVACIFLFELSWQIYWPVLVILAGFSMFLSGFIDSEEPVGRFINQIRPWFLAWGGAVILLGIFFLLNNMDWFDLSTILTNWWGIPILVAATGGIISALQTTRENPRFRLVVAANLFTSLVLAIPGILALTGVRLDLVGSILIIAIGIVLIVSIISKK
jgi:hypothetical protein